MYCRISNFLDWQLMSWQKGHRLLPGPQPTVFLARFFAWVLCRTCTARAPPRSCRLPDQRAPTREGNRTWKPEKQKKINQSLLFSLYYIIRRKTKKNHSSILFQLVKKFIRLVLCLNPKQNKTVSKLSFFRRQIYLLSHKTLIFWI